jgi:hypothetical protein
MVIDLGSGLDISSSQPILFILVCIQSPSSSVFYTNERKVEDI